jgi:Caspase domain
MNISKVDASRFAILIGINDYLNKPLSYCTEDVSQLQNALETYCRFPTGNIVPIISSEENPETRILEKYKSAVSEIKGKFKSGDTILFYFSGHGVFDDKSYIQFHETNVAIQKIYDDLNGLSPGSQFYLIDACYSGSGIEFKGESEAIANYYNDRFGQNSDGAYLLCSSRSYEKSLALTELKQSIYTWNIIKGMENSSLYDADLGSASIVDLHTYALKRILLDHGYSQTPFMFLKSSGYFPFAFKVYRTQLHEDEIVLEIKDENKTLEILDNAPVNFPEDFKRDFSQFLSELVYNLYAHNLATKVEIKIYNNTIEIHDFSRTSFNPFTAKKTEDGNGLVVYELFLTKYDRLITTSYSEGSPNIIKLAFDSSIFETPENNPCIIIVKEPLIYNRSSMNSYHLNPSCKEITIDMTKPMMPLSFIVRHLFDYLIDNTIESQLIILKLNEKDMQRDYIRRYIESSPKYNRLMVV